MPLSYQRLCGILSFLMPGLGQAFLGNYLAMLFFFAGFALFLSTPAFFRGLPLWSLFSALHAFFFAPHRQLPKKDNTWRNFCYLAVGFVGFFGWMMLFGPTVLPVGITLKMNARVDAIATGVRQFQKAHHRFPVSMEELKDLPGFRQNLFLDLWGREWVLKSNGSTFELRSLGPDGKPDTSDDLLYLFR